MTRKQKKRLLRIIVSAAWMLALLVLDFELEWYVELPLWLVPYLVIGYDVLLSAARGLIHGQLLDENFLMAIATVGALAIAIWGRGDYTEAVAVMLFYQIGELFQSIALGKSRKSISALMDIRPDFARVERAGELLELAPEEVAIGEIIIVNPGERVAIDGVIESGESTIDCSALTGESVPNDVSSGDEILSASVNLSSPLRICTTKLYGESAVARILDLVENASSRKSKSEKFISKFARIYTPAVCAAALLLAIIPPIVLGAAGKDANAGEWIYRALSFLVISCPCALVISIPMGFFASLGGASKRGILVKGSNCLETLAKVNCVATDKTGTLTKGRFEVREVEAVGIDAAKLLEYAAHAEYASSHPIARSIVSAYGGEIDRARVSEIRELRGKGVIATVGGVEVRIGTHLLVGGEPRGSDGATMLYVSVGGVFAGYITLADSPKENAAAAVRALGGLGVRTIMLTGDREEVGRAVAREVGIEDVRAELLPEDKVGELESLMESGRKVAFVGDGINDAPVLARADVGIAMGGIGSDAATDAADVVIMDDDISKVADAIKLSRKCMRIAKQNIVFSIGVKLACLCLVAIGVAGMDLAIFADVGVLVIAVINSMRGLY
jgi:Cd2+/Zn2+-exporting ATPase